MKHPRSRQTGRPGRTRAAPPVPQRRRASRTIPPGLWGLAPILAAIVVAAHSWYRFVGEPVADDFDFLQHRSSPGAAAWLDGGGSRFYWRPLARQLYYRVFGDLMLAHPAWMAALHAALLALAGWLLHRTLRRHWPAPWAAAAASFPILIEAGRTLLATPTSFQDLGAILFSALALQQATGGRMGLALAALLAALLCKEMAIVTALALPFIAPAPAGRARLRWAMAAGVVTAAWAAAYAGAVARADLLLARDAVQDPGALAVPWLPRLAWAAERSLLDAMSLPALTEDARNAALIALGALAGSALLIVVIDRGSRARVRARLPWIAGGLAWFALATATLADVHPDWRPYRTPFGAIGLGVACTALLGSVSPLLLAALVTIRLVALGMSPGPPATITSSPAGGSSLDFANLVRLQRLTGETRRELSVILPSPARGARVANNYYPVGALHALAGDRSLHTWYGDTTLRWVRILELPADERLGVAAVLQFQPTPPRQVVPLSVRGLWHLEQASSLIAATRWEEALRELALADSLQRDAGARVYESMVAGKRALALGGLGRGPEAERAATRSIGLWEENDDAYFALAVSALNGGRLDEAEAQLERLVRRHPDDPTLRGLLETARRRGPAPRH